jgi:hypothetical protein
VDGVRGELVVVGEAPLVDLFELLGELGVAAGRRFNAGAPLGGVVPALPAVPVLHVP